MKRKCGRINRGYQLQAAFGQVTHHSLFILQQKLHIVLGGDRRQDAEAGQLMFEARPSSISPSGKKLKRRIFFVPSACAVSPMRFRRSLSIEIGSAIGDLPIGLPMQATEMSYCAQSHLIRAICFAAELRAVNTPCRPDIYQRNLKAGKNLQIALQNRRQFRRRMRLFSSLLACRFPVVVNKMRGIVAEGAVIQGEGKAAGDPPGHLYIVSPAGGTARDAFQSAATCITTFPK